MGSARDKADAEAAALRAAERRAYDKQIAEANAKVQAAPVTIGSRNGLVVAAPSSPRVRDRQEFREAQGAEVLIPPRRAGATTGGDNMGNVAVTTVRQRTERQQSLAEIENTPVNERTALEQWHLDQENELQVRYKREREQKENEQAEVNRKNAEQLKFNQRMLPVKLMLADNLATEAESQKIWAIATQHPEFSVDKLYATLLELRRCIAAAPPRPGVK